MMIPFVIYTWIKSNLRFIKIREIKNSSPSAVNEEICLFFIAGFYLPQSQLLLINQFIIKTFTLLCKILNAISAIRFSLSSVGFTSVISKQQIFRFCINLLTRSSASLSRSPLWTGVPVPLEMEESRQSTSKLT